jgi:hypothetical protein
MPGAAPDRDSVQRLLGLVVFRLIVEAGKALLLALGVFLILGRLVLGLLVRVGLILPLSVGAGLLLILGWRA